MQEVGCVASTWDMYDTYNSEENKQEGMFSKSFWNTKPMQKRPAFSPPFLVSGVPTTPVRESGLSPVLI